MPTFLTAYRWELRKLVSQKRTYLGLGAAIAVPLIFVTALSLQSGSPNDVAFGKYVRESGLAIPLVLLLFASVWLFPLVTALVAGDIIASEHHNGTLKTIFTQKPSRLTVFVAKFWALVVVSLVLTVLVLAASAASSAVLALLDGQALQWPDLLTIVEATGALWLILVVWTGFGVLLAVICQQSALAVGIGLVYGFVVEGLIFGIFGSNATLRSIEKAFPGANAQSLTDAFGQAIRGRLGASQTALVDPAQAVIVLVAFTIAFLLISSVLVTRRDLA